MSGVRFTLTAQNIGRKYLTRETEEIGATFAGCRSRKTPYDIGATQTDLEGQQLNDSRVEAKINVR